VPVLQLRFGKKGDKVSYGGTEILKRNSKLATIGIGYADGILKLLKNTMSISINGKPCKIIGSITTPFPIILIKFL
ncbi:MAG: alanine racemase C-terminal domain-containing protein, partial [Bacteroidota bacterium]|nr:alanine racemase C-terminal domain-containing protein [Bacteroidota bacterium]